MDAAISKSFAKAQQLSGVSLSSFIASISVSVVVFAIEIIGFLAIRKRFPDLYPPVPKALKSTSKASLVSRLIRLEHDHDHLDRYFFRRYLRTMFAIFLPAALLITPILLPLNYIHGKFSNLGVSGLDTLGWSNVGLDHADRYWAHLVLSLLFIAHVCWVIWVELSAYIEIRQSSPHSLLSTILVDSIPESWLGEKNLTSRFNVFPGEVTNVSINRDLSQLTHLIAKREGLVRSLEVAETRHIRKTLTAYVNRQDKEASPFPQFWHLQGLATWLKFGKIETLHFYYKELQKVSEAIRTVRGKPEKFPQLPSAFITFGNPVAAHMACQTVIHTKHGYMNPRTLPLSIDDIVWANVCMSWWDRNIRSIISNLFILIAAIACAVPAAFIGLLSQVIYLTHAVAWLSWINGLPEWSLGVLQGVLPPILLVMLVKGFSSTLEYLVQKQGISSKSIMSLKIQDFYFCFLFIQLTLVISLSAGLTTIANEVAYGASLVTTLAKNLPKASNYFLSYVLLQALSISASSLLRIDRLIGEFLLAPMFDETVTQMLERREGQDIQWGTFVPVYTNLSCIGFLYAIISPVIIPFQVLALALFWLIYSKSTILLTKQDNGGLFYPNALKQLLIGLYLMELSLTALFLLARDTHGEAKCVGQACLMVLAIAITAVFHYLLCKAFDPLLVFTPISIDNLATRNPTQRPSFDHKDLVSTPAIRLPHDDLGISSSEVFQIREELREIIISQKEATIDGLGKIRIGR